MEVGLRLPLDAEVERPGDGRPAGAAAARRRPLAARAEVSVALRAAEQDVEIISGAATFHLRTLRNDDFPHLPAPRRDAVVTSTPRPFIDTVTASRARPRATTRARCSPASSSGPPSHELRMVATDSYRLSVKTTPLEAPLSAPLEANVPARALAEVVRIAAAGRGRDDLDRAQREPDHLHASPAPSSPRA